MANRWTGRSPESKIFGKFPCPCPIRELRLPQDMTETHPQNRRLGYARVSTYGQTLDTQLEQLRGGMQQDLPREGDRRAQRPARASQNAQRPRARRR